MSHHSDEDGPIADEAVKKFIKRGQGMQADIDGILNLGPTGETPHGRLTEDDKGQIRFTVGIKGDKVIMDFGTPVQWIGLTADNAREVGKTLIKHAKKINRGS